MGVCSTVAMMLRTGIECIFIVILLNTSLLKSKNEWISDALINLCILFICEATVNVPMKWTVYLCIVQSDGEAPSLLDGMGRIAYEQSGETFFLPFGLEDIELTGTKMQPDDQVEFFISTDEKYV